MKERIEWVDSIKGFAMLSVVLGHVVNGLNGAGLYEDNQQLLSNIQNAVDMYQMPVFALASGFLFEKAYWKNNELKKEKFNHQLFNTVILYFIWSILFCCIKLALTVEVNNSISLSNLLLLPFKATGPYWYFYILVELYLVFGLKFTRAMSSKILLPIFVVMGLLGSYCRLFEVRWFEYKSFLFYIFFFYFGILLAQDRVKKIYNKYVIMAICVLTIFLITFFGNNDSAIYNIPVISFVVAIGLVYILLVVFRCIGKVPGLNYIGKHCIEIYTIHIFLTSGSRIILRALEVKNVYIAIVAIFVISVVVPIVIAYLSKKVRVYNILFKPIDVVYYIKGIKSKDK